MWEEQIVGFAEHHKVVRCDMRGFGKSHLPDEKFGYHEDIRALVDTLKLPSTWLIGASFGAQIAVDFYLTYPRQVSGLVLISPIVSGFKPTDEIVQFSKRENALLEARKFEDATEHNLRMWVDGPHRSSGEVDELVRDRVAVMQMQTFLQPFPENVTLTRIDPLAIERLKEIQVPLLIISGSLDVPTFLQFSDTLEHQVPRAKRIVVPGVAHMVSMEAPQIFSDLVLEFISEHD